MKPKRGAKKSRGFIILIECSLKLFCYPLLLVGLLAITACSLIIKMDNLDNNLPLDHHDIQRSILGSVRSSDLVATTDEEIYRHYQYVLSKLGKSLTTVEKFVLISLIQMNLRPDLASPTSHLHIVTNLSKSEQYHAYLRDNDLSWPYLTGLEDLLINHRSPYRLLQFAKWLDQYFTQSKQVGNELAHFLKEQKDNLEKHQNFNNTFFKAKQPLSVDETLPNIQYTRLIKNLNSASRKVNHSNALILYQLPLRNFVQKDIKIFCNYDFSLYDQAKYNIHRQEIPNLSVGIMDKSGHYIMGISTQSLTNVLPLKETFFITGATHTDTLAVCFIKNTPAQSQFALVSTDSRDPGQLIYHLMQYEIFNSKNLLETSEYLNFPRHLFLIEPLRMVYESEKGSNQQLNRFLSMNFPIYHADSIGNLWLFASFGNPQQNGIVTDSRKNYYINSTDPIAK